MLIFMFLSLPLALKWPKQALWMKDTSLGQVGAVSRQPCQPDDSVCVPNMPDVAERTCMQDRQKLVSTYSHFGGFATACAACAQCASHEGLPDLFLWLLLFLWVSHCG